LVFAAELTLVDLFLEEKGELIVEEGGAVNCRANRQIGEKVIEFASPSFFD